MDVVLAGTGQINDVGSAAEQRSLFFDAGNAPGSIELVGVAVVAAVQQVVVPRIASFNYRQRVVAVSTNNAITSGTADEVVLVRSAIQEIRSRVSKDKVISPAPVNDVGAAVINCYNCSNWVLAITINLVGSVPAI